MKKIFYDKLSEKLYREIPDTLIATDKVMLSIEQFDVRTKLRHCQSGE